jgi:hypothetical protein
VNWALPPYLRSAKQEAQSYKNKEEKKRITAHKLRELVFALPIMPIGGVLVTN